MIIDQLQQASFRGVPFLVPSESKTGGKKTVVHDYPGSDRRYVEELGVQPPEFSLTAVVYGANAIQRRRRLEQALEQPGLGSLIHPSLGSLDVVALSYTSDSSDSEIGKFTFRIEFSRTESNISLNAAGITAGTISSFADVARSQIDAVFPTVYGNPRFLSNLSNLSELSQDISGLISDTISTVQNPSLPNLTLLANRIGRFDNTVDLDVRSGANIVSQLRSLYNVVLNVAGDPKNSLQFWEPFLNFGEDSIVPPRTTAKRIELADAQRSLFWHTRVNALVGSYESAAFSDFGTVDDVVTTRKELNTAYAAIMENTCGCFKRLNSETRTALSQLRNATRRVLDDKVENAWRVVTVEPGRTSLALLNYRYYESLNNLDQLRGLNPTINYSSSEQPIQAVSG